MLDAPLPTAEWPYFLALQRLALALCLGLFVGLERQRSGKEAGIRTFAFAALLCCMGSLLGPPFALMALGLLGVLVVLLNLHSLRMDQGTELTTSAALLVMGFVGVLCGHGHTLTPTAVGVLTAALLAWKQPMTGFSLGLTEAELRSAILLAILAFVIYPALPIGAVDPWGLIAPRPAWLTVLLIAGIGFANYVLLKMYGARAVELTGFFGGLVNSTVTVTALAERVRHEHGLIAAAYRGILLATAAMLLRNSVLLALLAPRALAFAAPALLLMLAACVLLVVMRGRPTALSPPYPTGLHLESPFSLSSALKFGLVFLVLEVAGTLAQALAGAVWLLRGQPCGRPCLQRQQRGVRGFAGRPGRHPRPRRRHGSGDCIDCQRPGRSAASSPGCPRASAHPANRPGAEPDRGDWRGRGRGDRPVAWTGEGSGGPPAPRQGPQVDRRSELDLELSPARATPAAEQLAGRPRHPLARVTDARNSTVRGLPVLCLPEIAFANGGDLHSGGVRTAAMQGKLATSSPDAAFPFIQVCVCVRNAILFRLPTRNLEDPFFLSVTSLCPRLSAGAARLARTKRRQGHGVAVFALRMAHDDVEAVMASHAAVVSTNHTTVVVKPSSSSPSSLVVRNEKSSGACSSPMSNCPNRALSS